MTSLSRLLNPLFGEKRHPAATPLFLLGLSILFFGGVLFPPGGEAIGAFDMRGLFYPWLEQVRLTLTGSGRLPWWDASRFSGYPFLSNPQVAIFYPFTWLGILLPTRIGISLIYLIHLWLAGWGMTRLASRMVGDEDRTGAAALAAGVTFMFAGFFTARMMAGHMGLIAVHAWVPWLLWGTHRALKSGRWQAAVQAGGFFALAILAGHTTSLVYVGLIWGVFALFWMSDTEPALIPNLRARRLQQIGLLGLIFGMGLLLSGAQLVPLAEFIPRSARSANASYEFATDFSFPPSHLITLLVPEYFGEPTRAGYWSVPNFEELTAYLGILPLLGMILALSRPKRRSWFLLGLVIFGILLALGRYGFLYRILYDWVPPFRVMRAPGRAMFFFVLAGSLLLADGLSRPRVPSWWRQLTSVGLVAGLSAMAAVGAVFAATHPTETSGRLWHQLGGFGMATGLFLVSVLVIGRWIRQNRSPVWSALLVLIVVVDLWTFGMKLRRLEPMTPAGYWSAAQDLIPPDSSVRVLPWGVSIFDQNGAGQVGLDSAFGYNALEVGAYTDLVSSIPDPRASSYDVIGSGYVVSTTPLDQFANPEDPNGIALLGESSGAWVYTRPNVLPQVRLVNRVEVHPDRAAAIDRIHQPDFDRHTTATVDQAVGCVGEGEPGSAEVMTKRDGYWEIKTSSPSGALLVVAETAYPGWRVAVDGASSEWVTVYGALRGVCVPAGEHLITWRFVPMSFVWGGLLSLVGLIVLGLSWRVGAPRAV